MLECLLPLVSAIIKKSLVESDFPVYFKKAHVRPLIKKLDLDKECWRTTISSLPFLSKVVEIVVATQLEGHLTTHKLHDNLQSAYLEDHYRDCPPEGQSRH